MEESTATVGWFSDPWFGIPMSVALDEELSKNGFMVYVAIRSFTDNAGTPVYPSIKTIAKRARLTKNPAKEAIKELITIGYAKIVARTGEDGRRTSNFYYLSPSRGSESDPSPTQNLTPPRSESDPELYKSNQTRVTEILPTPLAPVSKKKEYASRVHLTELEYSALCTRFTKSVVDAAIQTLDAYKEAHGRSYKSDAGALRQWAIPATNERLLKTAKFGGVSASVNPKFSGRVCPKCGELNNHSGGMCLKCNEDLPRRKA